MDTKSCNLSMNEVLTLIEYHGKNIAEDVSERLDRINYLNKRLKAFDERKVNDDPKNDKSWGSQNG